jgi:hypothetical protein
MTDIVYIGAVGRSGTTLLERTLATAEHVTALGEVVHLWERSVGHNEPCGCGQPFDECPFWIDVGKRAFGGWGHIDLEQLRRDRRAVDRNRNIPLLIAPTLSSRSFRAARRRLIDVLDRLYVAIAAVASNDGSNDGSHIVLVDSSKHPSYLYLLRSLPSHRVHLLHVVRDPRGVAHSWSKQVVRPESGEDMERLGTLRAVTRWTTHNLLFQLYGLVGTRRRMAYERFTDDPSELFRRTESLLGASPGDIGTGTVERHGVELDVDHTVSGNPMRFRVGEIAIRSDQAWTTSMPRRKRIVVGAVTTPLRQLYSR